MTYKCFSVYCDGVCIVMMCVVCVYCDDVCSVCVS